MTFLEANPDKAEAWSIVHQIGPADIRTYVATLTPVLLQADTRVTNHGFGPSGPTPKQSVLQAGTAVLVDDRGVPRVRCACGNPLLEPTPTSSAPNYSGEPWPAFSPAAVEAIVPAPAPLQEIIFEDINTGGPIARPVGSSGGQDAPAPEFAAPGTTSAPIAPPSTDPVVVGDIPEPNAMVTQEGSVTASSVYSNEFPESYAVDGDPTTSWFSGGEGKDGKTSTYVWTGAHDELITLIRIVGNGENSNSLFQTDFGFDSVTIRVFDADGDVAFEQKVSLSGTPDPTIEVRPGVVGFEIVLDFSGHEDPGCGGFAELVVGVTR